jgi:thiol-disulfide isomerase/thioredoxin
MYLIVMKPDNKFFELLVDADNQNFEVETAHDDPQKNMKIKGSTDNKLFYEYLHFIAKLRPEADTLRKQLDAAKDDKNKADAIQKKLDKLNDDVKIYQDNLIKNHPKSLTAAIIKSTLATELPEFSGTEDEINVKKWLFTRDHYFDNMDLKDDRLVRTSFLFQRIDHYVNKLTVQDPDSIKIALDRILKMMDPKGENFKFYLVHFLNFYAKSKFAGMDAIYVHLVKNYYEKGLAYWTDEETLKKISENATKLEPTLIGKIAPNITLQKQDGSKISLNEIQSPYTVMFFWDPECGHCKKASPFVVEFGKKWKEKGVTIFSICTKTGEESSTCWKSAEEKQFSDFINVIDPYLKSRYKTLYDISTTPRIFILDKNKKILMKGIGGEDLDKVMEQIIKIEEENLKKESQGR